MTTGLQVEIEIDFACHPLVVEFGKKCVDEAQAGILVGEDACYSSASSQLAVDPLQAIGGAQPDTMGRWEIWASDTNEKERLLFAFLDS